MREHNHLPAMVSFVDEHIAEHFHSDGPRLGPSVSTELLDPAVVAKRIGKHLRATNGAFGQSLASQLWRTLRAVELCRNFQVGSRKFDPLAAHIVNVGEDRRYGADFARRSRSPGERVEMVDKDLIHTIVRGKHLGCGCA